MEALDSDLNGLREDLIESKKRESGERARVQELEKEIEKGKGVSMELAQVRELMKAFEEDIHDKNH